MRESESLITERFYKQIECGGSQFFISFYGLSDDVCLSPNLLFPDRQMRSVVL